MVASGEVTEDIQDLFLEILKNSNEIDITLEEVKTKIGDMIIV
jgi:hypothetical protein